MPAGQLPLELLKWPSREVPQKTDVQACLQALAVPNAFDLGFVLHLARSLFRQWQIIPNAEAIPYPFKLCFVAYARCKLLPRPGS